MRYLLTFVLMIAVLVSALQVVIAQHQSRKLFVEIQEQERIQDELNDLWSRLQLEESTWATDDRVETQARTRLNMIDPGSDSLKILIK